MKITALLEFKGIYLRGRKLDFLWPTENQDVFWHDLLATELSHWVRGPAVEVGFPPNFSGADSTDWVCGSPAESCSLWIAVYCFPLKHGAYFARSTQTETSPPTLWQPTLAQTRFKWRELEGPDFVGNDIIPTRNVKKDPLSPHSEKSCCLKLKRNLNALRSLRWFARKSVIFWDSLVVRWIPFCLLPGLLALAGNHQSVSKQQKVYWSAFVL